MTGDCEMVADGFRVDAEFRTCSSGENQEDNALRQPGKSRKVS